MILAAEEDLATPIDLFIYSENFQEPRKIPQAGHFPWIENPKAVIQAFREFCCTIDRFYGE